ncbi:MAG: helix-hairpin-helix domain-containing protein, partial [Alphaproteobacteria bacterium]
MRHGEKMQTTLLDWYDVCRRDLPWRAAPGETPDAYRVWLSEIMLQQTTVKVVASYYAKFLQRWPGIEDLAEADLEDILKAWAGLGYYARARNLHACARKVTDEFSGRFPEDEKELLSLPGIGPYTAAAIAAIAFDKQAAVMDGNVERVLARVYAVKTPLPRAKHELRAALERLAPVQ